MPRTPRRSTSQGIHDFTLIDSNEDEAHHNNDKSPAYNTRSTCKYKKLQQAIKNCAYKEEDCTNIYRLLQLFPIFPPVYLQRIYWECGQDLTRTIDNILYIKRFCSYLVKKQGSVVDNSPVTTDSSSSSNKLPVLKESKASQTDSDETLSIDVSEKMEVNPKENSSVSLNEEMEVNPKENFSVTLNDEEIEINPKEFLAVLLNEDMEVSPAENVSVSSNDVSEIMEESTFVSPNSNSNWTESICNTSGLEMPKYSSTPV